MDNLFVFGAFKYFNNTMLHIPVKIFKLISIYIIIILFINLKLEYIIPSEFKYYSFPWKKNYGIKKIIYGLKKEL